MALHGFSCILCLFAGLFAESGVALGEAPTAPSGATLPSASQQPQQPARKVSQAAMSGGGDAAEAAPSPPTVCGSSRLRQSAPQGTAPSTSVC